MQRRPHNHNHGAGSIQTIHVAPPPFASDKQPPVDDDVSFPSSATSLSSLDKRDLLAKRMPLEMEESALDMPINDILIYKNLKMSVIIMEFFLCYVRPRSETRGSMCMEMLQWLKIILLLLMTALFIYVVASDDYSKIWNSVTDVINTTGIILEIGLSLITCYFHCYWSRWGEY